MFKNIFIILLSLMFLGCTESNDGQGTEPFLTPANGECNTDALSSTNPITRPMLVVLVSYNDIRTSSPVSTWNSKMFGKNVKELNHYYDEISHSQFEFVQATECLGVASVHLNKNHPNVAIDSSVFNSLVNPDLKSSLQALDANIAFDVYDTNGNGHITPDELLITFIIAGYEDAYEGKHVTQGIWGHQSCVSSSYTPTLDGVTLMGCLDDGNYALFGEKHNKANPHDATIGIIAHELGHSAFSLPDLYNTDDSSSGGIGVFGLMGSGTWTQKNSSEYAGETPTHMTAWSKVHTGWITPDDTNGTKVLNATSSDSFNIVKISINSNEYYLLENRNNSGYDRGLYMLNGDFNGGLAVWHIDETKLTSSKISQNDVNTDNDNKGVDLVEAAEANIDSGGSGHEKNLFYFNNVDALNQANLSDVGSRGETMTLEVN
jgi:M6 family metalloprotease-like protein